MRISAIFRTFFLAVCLLLAAFNGLAQNSSNQGTDFWVAYTGHVDGTLSRLTLFITSKKNATVNITAGGAVLPLVTVQANKAVPVYINPNVYTNTYVGLADGIKTNAGIHVTSDVPIVLYSHISRSARSAATMILPTKALGNDYYAMAYNQMPSDQSEYRVSEFTVVGVEDNTVVEITPSVPGVAFPSKQANQAFQITLNKGDVYQYQSTTDVTGSRIRTLGGCKPLAVFSGSTKVGFCEAPGSVNGSGQDNLYQQLFPVSTWGKNYVTAPFYNALNGVKDIIRIFVATDNTTVTVNGSTTTANGVTLNNPYAKGSVITFATNTPNVISASEPISVAQIQVSQSCNPINTNLNNPVFPGDPELTVLNPVEQTLTDITLYSAVSVPAAPTNITKHYLNIILKTADIPSLKIDNVSQPASSFTNIDGTYSYIIKDVTAASAIDPTHRITADGGFLAIAYGYGVYESYAYLAGSDIKNLTQFIEVKNPANNQPAGAGCANQDYEMELTLSYQTTELRWDPGNGQPEIVQANPVFDRQIVLNGQNLYIYKLSTSFNYITPGTKAIIVKAYNPGASLCGDYDIINLYFDVNPLPTASFSVNSQACLNAPVTFTDNSVLGTAVVKKWTWDFKDGQTLEATNGNPVQHAYVSVGDYQPLLKLETDAGCVVTSALQPVHVSPLPVAQFSISSPNCEQQAISFTDQSTAAEGTVSSWSWNFGQGRISSLQNPSITFSHAGQDTIRLVVTNTLGCSSLEQSRALQVHPLPVVDFSVPNICLSDPQAVFVNASTNADGSTTGLAYLWNFGDNNASGSNPNTSTLRDPGHNYSREGNYTIGLNVTTAQGCTVSLEKPFQVNGVNPVAAFEILNESNLCSSNSVQFKNKSYVAGFGAVTRLEWYFDFQNQPAQVLVDNNPSPDKIYTYTYPKFSSPASINYTVRLLAYSGGVCVSTAESKVLTMKAVPEVAFAALPSVCQETSPYQITQASEIHGTLGTYRFSGPGLSVSGTFNPKVAGIGTHTLKYVFTSQNTCADSLSRTITVFATPTVNAGRDTTILEGGAVLLNASASGNALNLLWTPATALSATNILNPLATPIEDIRYQLTVRSGDGCVNADEVFVQVLKLPVVPNSFSPNGDGINEVWNIKYLNSYQNATVEIFNRYGQRVYFSKGYEIPWDGRANGADVPMATYYYIINPGNGRKPMAGSLTIIR